MRKIVEFFVKQHLFGNLVTFAVIGVGLYSMFAIRREVFPNVQFDILTVVTVFPGASPDEVERLVTSPLEQDIKEVDGIKRLQSNSVESRSGITIWLDPDQKHASEGKSDIQDVIDRSTDLPEAAEDPLVTSLESKQQPIIEVSISGDMPEMELRNTAKMLEDELEKVAGVARVVHRGLRDIEIRVEADARKLAKYRLSLDEVVGSLKKQNLSIPGGLLEVSPQDSNGRERLVRTIGEFHTLEDVANTVIRANELGEAIKVSDVAKVFFDLERATVVNNTNGKRSLSLTVLKKERSDAIELVDSVKEKMTQLQNGVLDKRVQVDYINDFSYFIRRRLGILTGNFTIGLGLVLLMLPLLIPFRFALLIALGEPFAFLGTILLLYSWGSSINLISMIGLIIVSGILVDDSIVVTENAVRLVEEGKDPEEAAVEGTLQIMGPVTASVLATSVAFLPMAFMSGIFGRFIREIPITVLTALAVSLIETFFILPGHIAHWIKVPKKGDGPSALERKGPIKRFLNFTRNFWDVKIVPRYIRWLTVAVHHRYKVCLGLVGLLVGSVLLAATGMKFVLFPPEGVEIFFIRTEAPTATSLARHEILIKSIEDAVRALPENELDDFTTSIGLQQQDPNDPTTRRGSEFAQVAVFLSPEQKRDRTAQQIIDDLRAKVGTPSGLTRVTFQRVNPGPPQGKPVSLGVRAAKYESILPAVKELKETLGTIAGVTDVTDNYTLGKEEMQVKVNASEAAAAGLSVASIGTTVRAAFEGVVATTVRELNEEMDVRVSFPAAARTNASSLESIFIPNPSGALIPLSQVSRITRDQHLAVYEHEGHQRQVKVTAELDTQLTTSNEVNGKIRNLLPELSKKYPAVRIDFGGEAEDTTESMASLKRAFLLAVLGIFLILVATFKSILQPAVILLTIPLGIISVIWAFFFHGMPFSFLSSLGMIALSGVIVNNAIVLVDFVNQARREGMGKLESILKGSETRVRPIFLTTVTTVVGILPTAYGIGGLDKFVVPIALALGWGLMFGSILTAFIFPAALAVLDDFEDWTARRFKRKAAH